MSRILGIDFGTKRVGLALSDESGGFALPLMVLENNKSLFEMIVETAQANDVRLIVIGESTNYAGKPNKIQGAIIEFQKQLQTKGFEVILEPEFMTSMQAERFQGKTALTDASAAALILQSHLDKMAANK